MIIMVMVSNIDDDHKYEDENSYDYVDDDKDDDNNEDDGKCALISW